MICNNPILERGRERLNEWIHYIWERERRRSGIQVIETTIIVINFILYLWWSLQGGGEAKTLTPKQCIIIDAGLETIKVGGDQWGHILIFTVVVVIERATTKVKCVSAHVFIAQTNYSVNVFLYITLFIYIYISF